jgi:hypothetical protein
MRIAGKITLTIVVLIVLTELFFVFRPEPDIHNDGWKKTQYEPRLLLNMRRFRAGCYMPLLQFKVLAMYHQRDRSLGAGSLMTQTIPEAPPSTKQPRWLKI